MNSNIVTLWGILIPFLGTSLGAGCVFFLKNTGGVKLKNLFSGFAAGVMLASLFWSLLTPALAEKSSLVPVAVGFLLGMGLFLLGDSFLEKINKKSSLSGKNKMILAVTLHNVPEGMAVGIAFAGARASAGITLTAAFLLAVGIALQNFPEGAIISTPLKAIGIPKRRAFLWGVFSGVVEPLGALISLTLTSFTAKLLPFVLAFAAGAMLFVVSDELVPSLEGKEKKIGLWGLSAGFLIMMTLDVLFG